LIVFRFPSMSYDPFEESDARGGQQQYAAPPFSSYSVQYASLATTAATPSFSSASYPAAQQGAFGHASQRAYQVPSHMTQAAQSQYAQPVYQAGVTAASTAPSTAAAYAQQLWAQQYQHQLTLQQRLAQFKQYRSAAAGAASSSSSSSSSSSFASTSQPPSQAYQQSYQQTAPQPYQYQQQQYQQQQQQSSHTISYAPPVRALTAQQRSWSAVAAQATPAATNSSSTTLPYSTAGHSSASTPAYLAVGSTGNHSSSGDSSSSGSSSSAYWRREPNSSAELGAPSWLETGTAVQLDSSASSFDASSSPPDSSFSRFGKIAQGAQIDEALDGVEGYFATCPPAKRKRVPWTLLLENPTVKGLNNAKPPLRDFVKRCYSTCETETEARTMHQQLAALLAKTSKAGKLHRNNWNKQYVPIVSDSQETRARKAHVQHLNTVKKSFVTLKAERKALKREKKLSKKESKKTSKRFMLDDVHSEQSKKRKIAERRQRFQDSYRVSDADVSDHLRVAEEGMDWDLLTIKGTCQDIEKIYLRLTSAPDPSTVRPPRILKRSLKHVKRRYREGAEYLWLCDQLKSIRQDLTVQRVRDEFSVRVYETHARIALENGDRGEYNQCQSQLKQLYAKGMPGHREEFLAYRLLFCVYSQTDEDLLREMLHLTKEDRQVPCIQHALQVRAAVALNNYTRVFRLYASAPNMSAYVMDLFLPRLRIRALFAMCIAYHTLETDFVSKLFVFDSTDECIEYLEAVPVLFQDDAQHVIDLKNSRSAILEAKNNTR